MAGRKFQFSLKNILSLRMHETEGARQELSRILQERERQETAVADARRYLNYLAKRRSLGASGQRSLSRLESFRQEAHDRLETAKRKLQRLEILEEEARILLMERKVSEEALVRLREREETRYWREHQAAETQFLDEQALSRFQRQRRAANS